MELITTIVLLALVGIAAYWFLFKPKGNFPPGPSGFPLVGNLFQIPLDVCTHVTFTKWAKKYGPIYSLKFARVNGIVLSDPKLIREAFNDPVFSGRPDNKVFKSMSRGDYGVLSADGQVWSEQRRFTLRHLREFGFGKNQMETLILDEAKELIEGLKADEGKPITVARRFNIAILNSLWIIATGERLNHDDPKLNAVLEEFFKQLDEVFVRGIVGFIPELTSIAPERTGWNALKRALDNMEALFKGLIQEHEKTLIDDQPRDFIDSYLVEMRKTKDKESSFHKDSGYKNLLAIINDLFAAGAETTSTTMSWAVLFLAYYPKVQKELQKEIDAVIGQSRLPALSDKANMPYTEALMMEISRKASIAGLGLFHTTTAETKLAGYDIPKGAFVIPNFHYVHHDPKIWDSPYEFKPERFLSSDRKTVLKNDALMPFSVGKRVCLGESLAKDEFFLFLTSIFQRFDIELDPTRPTPSLEPDNTFICKPHEFYVLMHDRLSK